MGMIKNVALVILISLSVSIYAEENDQVWEILDELGQYYNLDMNGYVATGSDFMNWASNSVQMGPLSTDDLQNLVMNNPQGTSFTGPSLAVLGAELLDFLIDGEGSYSTVDIDFKANEGLGFDSLTGPFLLNGSNNAFNATHSYEEKKTRIFWPNPIHTEICTVLWSEVDTCEYSNGETYRCIKERRAKHERKYELGTKLSKMTDNGWVTLHDNRSSQSFLFDTDVGTWQLPANKVFTDNVSKEFGFQYKIEFTKKEYDSGDNGCSLLWEDSPSSTYTMNVDSDMDGYYDNIPGLFYNKAQAELYELMFSASGLY